MSLHLGRSSSRGDPRAVSRLQLLQLSFHGIRRGEIKPEELKEIFLASLPTWDQRDEMLDWDVELAVKCGLDPTSIVEFSPADRSERGTRPPLRPTPARWVRGAEELRVLIHPIVRVVHVFESQYAVLHRLGMLSAEQEELFAAGLVPREYTWLSEDFQKMPGVVSVAPQEWQAMTEEQRTELIAQVQLAHRTASAKPSSAPTS